MKRTQLALLGLGLLLAGCSSAGDGVEPGPGDVFIADSPNADDRVSFYLAPSTSREDATERARVLMEAAGLDVAATEVDTRDEGRILRVRIETSIGERTAVFERSIPGSLVAALSDSDRLFVDLSAFARLDSGGELAEVDRFGRTYRIEGGDVRYHFSLAHILSIVGGLALLMAATNVAVRLYVGRLRRRDEQPVETVHKLQRLMLVSMTLLPLVLLGFLFTTGAISIPELLVSEVFPNGGRGLGAITFMLPWMILMMALVLSLVMPIQPYYRELRDIRQTDAQTRRRMVRGLLAGLGLPLVWFGGLSLVGTGLLPGWTRVPLMILLFVIILALGPFVVSTALGKANIDPQLRRRLIDFAHANGVRVRDVRALQGRSEKHGNAFVAGVLPGLKYIFVTDYLIEEMADDELMAIVAHEIGHGKKRHLLIKLFLPFVLIALTVGIVAISHATGILGGSATSILFVSMPLIMIVSIFLVQGALALKMEHAADDYARQVVGLDPTIRALEKLAEMNMAKRNSGKVFNLFAQHPAIEKRIEHLRDSEAGPAF